MNSNYSILVCQYGNEYCGVLKTTCLYNSLSLYTSVLLLQALCLYYLYYLYRTCFTV